MRVNSPVPVPDARAWQDIADAIAAETGRTVTWGPSGFRVDGATVSSPSAARAIARREALDTGLSASLECVTAKHRGQGWSIGQDPVSGVWSASRRLTQSTQQWTVSHTLAELDARLDELDGTGD